MSRLQEFQELFCQIKNAWNNNEQTVLVILADVKGSAYRLPGTKMLMTSSGLMAGNISGGCLEADLFEWAKKVFESNKPMNVRYDLSETEIWSLGIGCKGNLEFLFLPIDPKNPTWKIIDVLLAQEQPFTLIIDMEHGNIAVLEMEDTLAGEKNVPKAILENAYLAFNRQTRAEIYTYNDERFFIDVVKPSERLVVAGAGKDAIPVVELAYKAGFSVTVLDERSHFNNQQFFPNAKHVTIDLENLIASELKDSWWVIMNHHQEKDEASLKYAIENRPRYIGVLGPKYRTNEMLENIGYTLNNAPIFSPVGLDIGAESIDEVAISIIAEIMSLRAGRIPQSLNGKEKIHV